MSAQPNGKRPKNCHRDPKSPFWQYEFTIDGDRERGSTGTSSSRDAAAFVEARKAEMRRRHADRRDGSGRRIREKISIADACALYQQKRGGDACPATTRYQLENLVAILCEQDDHRLLSDIVTADIQRFRLRRKSLVLPNRKPVKESSINREVELARAVWRYAELCGYEVGDPPVWSKVIDKSAEVSRVRELRADEETRLFEALSSINPDLRVMAEFAMLCAARRAQVVRLQWGQINLDTREATILLKTKGPEKRPHTFPLTARMVEIIQSREKVGPFVFTYVCRRNAPARDDRPRRIAGVRFPFSESGWTKQWRKALKDAGIGDFRWHDLRHTAATRLLRKVNNLRAAQALLGHASLDQTARYAHVFNDDLRAMMEAVEAQRSNRQAPVETGNVVAISA